MYWLLRRLLFCLPPEMAHRLSLQSMDILARLGLSGIVADRVSEQPLKVMGLNFPNPVGLAAGMDKDADHLKGLAKLGFGFIEVGTVTPRAQAGNPQPRMFRLVAQGALINRMGFNNLGADHLVDQVRRSGYRGVLGINIGKNADTPVEKAVDDYIICMRKVYPHASYITLNLSSPNTPGLRDLQFGEPLKELLLSVKRVQKQLEEQYGKYVPLALKIAPDMAEDDIRQVAETLMQVGIDGVIATNTTIARSGVEGVEYGDEKGGLSGAPLSDRSVEVIRSLSAALQGKIPIIGVGGIMDGPTAAQKIAAGASLIQVYTGFIYRGPSLISEANEAIKSLKKVEQ